MSKPASSGIQTAADGQAYIPSSRRADGSTRKEIKVRPGYRPPEDVETYKSRNAEAWRTREPYVPGADDTNVDKGSAETKSKNAKRREAARKKKEQEVLHASDNLEDSIGALDVQETTELAQEDVKAPIAVEQNEQDSEKQKKIRNHLKKLRAVRELKAKKTSGEKLSADQVIKIAKEQEIIRDLVKLGYEGPELEDNPDSSEVPSHPV